MRVIIGIDDTDALGTKGTGSIASEMAGIIEDNGWGTTEFVSRHQLLLHPEIPYTSHNSSMIFPAEVDEKYLDQMKEELFRYLKQESAEGSDPGLCIVCVDTLTDRKSLIEYGYLAKSQVLTKESAIRLAEALGIYLGEAGGTGIGIIGALAGCGLRLCGKDGEVKGGLKAYHEGDVVPVRELLKHKKISDVIDDAGHSVPKDDLVEVVWKVKPVIVNGAPILIVMPGGEKGKWLAMTKQEMRDFGDARANIQPCDLFELDVEEELMNGEENTCFNCAFRRWTDDSFCCMKSVEGRCL